MKHVIAAYKDKPYVNCSSNSDCGDEGWIGSSFCSDNDVYQIYRTYICSNPGIPSSSCQESDESLLKQTCPDGCSDGVCNVDTDNDGIFDDIDNCPAIYNPGQTDDDNDGIGNACDSCPNDSGNDTDGDGICGDVDNCVSVVNPGQEDDDNDGIGNVCEASFLPSLFLLLLGD
jgi:hypothetical protein